MNNGNGPVVAATGLCKRFGEGVTQVEALRGIDVSIRRGEFVAVMGASGSGKSTLLHILGGLDTPSDGLVMIEGRDLAALSDDELTLLRRKHIGFIFQAFNLISVLTAEENVSLPLTLDGVPEREATARAKEALSLTGLVERGNHTPDELSGGEQQRVAVARALVNKPLLLLADEPTGNLDSATGTQIISLLRGLADEQGQTILMVTHDARQAAMADRVLTLKDGCIVDEQRLHGGQRPAEILAELR